MVWFDLGYVAGWLQRPRLAAPLVTIGSTNDPHPGSIGQAGTAVAFGDDQYRFSMYSGFQATLGVNLNDRLYLEVSALVFPTQHNNFTVSSDLGGNPLIARPVFNTAVGEERSFLTSAPGVLTGSTSIDSRSQLWGFEAAARYRMNLTPYLTGDWLIGYRHMELIESLQITDQLNPLQQSITFQGQSVLPPSTLADSDRFATNNQFHGVDLGGRVRWQSGYDWFGISAYGKVALGATYQTVDIAGVTTLYSPTPAAAVPGGVLALPSNSGTFNRTVFGVIPEGGVNFLFTPFKYVRFQVGYSALYWNDVVRPGNQIDHRVNPSQVPSSLGFTGGAPVGPPFFVFRPQGLVLQTLNVGFTLYY
jgi:hypothetical protein